MCGETVGELILSLSEEVMKANKVEVLPRTMDAVITALENDKVLLDALQPRFAQ